MRPRHSKLLVPCSPAGGTNSFHSVPFLVLAVLAWSSRPLETNWKYFTRSSMQPISSQSLSSAQVGQAVGMCVPCQTTVATEEARVPVLLTPAQDRQLSLSVLSISSLPLSWVLLLSLFQNDQGFSKYNDILALHAT